MLPNIEDNNVFLYWIGKDYKIIKFLRSLIYHHSDNGNNFTVHLINESNVQDYIDNFPGEFFWNLKPANQADFIRVNVLYKWGGIWLDSDTIVMTGLEELFEVIKKRGGFFILQPEYKGKKWLCNSVLGTKPNTELYRIWKNDCFEILSNKREDISWDEIGTSLLEKYKFKNEYLFNQYQILDGFENTHPVHWSETYQEFIEKPYDNWRKIERDFQPLIIINNEAYKKSEDLTEAEILSQTPLSYFIKKSLKNGI